MSKTDIFGTAKRRDKREGSRTYSVSSSVSSSTSDPDHPDLEKKKQDLMAEVAALEKKKEDLKRKQKKLDREIKKRAGEIHALEGDSAGSQISFLKKNPTCRVDLDNIEISKKLPVGASGTIVYTCTVDGWNCAVKELSREKVDEGTEMAFESEISLLEHLPTHPNICKYLFHIRDEKTVRLFMTRYDANMDMFVSFKTQHDPSFFFEKQILARCSLDIVKGLEFLHSKKIMHRDLKPGNIFVQLGQRDEILKCVIGDFDTAKKVSVKNKAVTIIGTPAFMAPEVLTAGEHGSYDFSADVYSFGMILYVMITLRQPFQGDRPYLIPDQILKGKIPEISAQQLAVDPSYEGFGAMYKQCCARIAPDRPSLVQLKAVLAQLLA